MGDTQHLHHLHVFAIEKIEGHRDVEAHVHASGRYKFKSISHDNALNSSPSTATTTSEEPATENNNNN